MAYPRRYQRRPLELASKISHHHIIQDKRVARYLSHCRLPKKTINHQQAKQDDLIGDHQSVPDNPIKYTITVDGSYTVIPASVDLPSSKIAFLQFGVNLLDLKQLDEIARKPFISVSDMSSLRKVDRLQLTLPVANLTYKDSRSLTESFRQTLNEFFNEKGVLGRRLQETLIWLVFKTYQPASNNQVYTLSRCPNISFCHQRGIKLTVTAVNNYSCPGCGIDLFLIDIFGAHEAIDSESSIGVTTMLLTNIMAIIEQLMIIQTIKYFIDERADSFLSQTLFIKDGPLAFFKMPVTNSHNLHNLTRQLLNFLKEQGTTINLIGLEKSGLFVDHADLIGRGAKSQIQPGQYLLLNNNYIAKNIANQPSKPSNYIYGEGFYYSGKLIFKDRNQRLHVISLPTSSYRSIINLSKEHFTNLDPILTIVERLKCDMYDNALIPIVLANKSISIASKPSVVILKKFAQQKTGQINRN